MQKYQIDFIELSIFAGALKFGKFKLKSGRESPYFFNAGVFYSGEFSAAVGRILADFVLSKISTQEFDIIFGPAYKGIPLALSLAYGLAQKGINKQWCFNRKEKKQYADGGEFVGAPLVQNSKIIIIDDVFTTGGAKEEALEQIKKVADVKLSGVFILLDRQEKNEEGKNAILEFEKKYSTKVYSIVSADEIFDYLLKNKINGKQIINDEIYNAYKEYKTKYGI
jgi:orotate phosphoribosyltransferase